jgi:hypothetical protein
MLPPYKPVRALCLIRSLGTYRGSWLYIKLERE